MGIKFDTREFEKAMAEYLPTTKKALPEVLNERGAKVTERAFDAVPPFSNSDLESKKKALSDYLRTPISTAIKFAKSGKRRGHYIPKKARRKNLMRGHLILQAMRAKAGKKGLYGQAMAQAFGRFTGRKLRSVGYLKSVFIPIIRTFNRVSKWKIPTWKTERISRWPGSSGYGRADPAKPGWNPIVKFEIQGRVRDEELGKVEAIYETAFNIAFRDEARELEKHVEEKMRTISNRHNAR